jgi:DNA-binding MarR family transcriptional regulator
MYKKKSEQASPTREGGFLIARIFQVSGRIFARKLRERGLGHITPEQGRVLFALWRGDDVSIQELVRSTSLSKSTLTATLDRLEGSGHVIRVPSTTDRRKIMIRLTEKDRRLRERYALLSAEMSDMAYRGFREEEIVAFEAQLYRILKNMTEKE